MCPASLRAERAAPQDEPSDEAIEGQEIHAAMESEDFTGLDERGLSVAEGLMKLETEAVAAWTNKHGAWQVNLREDRHWIQERGTFRKLASAKPDRVFIGRDVALVIDYKAGYLQTTPAYRNIQMRWQALALWSEYPEIKEITSIVAAYRFRGKLDPVIYDVPLLEKAQQELEFKLWLAEQEHANFNPGDWCRYCRARGTCKAAAAWSLLPTVEVGTLAAQKLGVQVNLEHCLAAVEHLTPQQMAFMHGNAQVIAKILEAIKTRLKGMPDDTLQAVGLKKSAPTKVRQLPEVGAVWAWIWESLNSVLPGQKIKMEEFQAVCKASVGSLQALVADRLHKRDGGSKKDSEFKAKTLLEGIVSYEEQEPKLLKL